MSNPVQKLCEKILERTAKTPPALEHLGLMATMSQSLEVEPELNNELQAIYQNQQQIELLKEENKVRWVDVQAHAGDSINS
jgi:hypothetical protein